MCPFCSLSVPDQSPNLGLFWYFFTETFEHFRVFFLCIFQINAFIYVLPLTIRFRYANPVTIKLKRTSLYSNHPVFLSYILLSLMALFKSYPVIGDLTVPLALLPLWSHTFRCMLWNLFLVSFPDPSPHTREWIWEWDYLFSQPCLRVCCLLACHITHYN